MLNQNYCYGYLIKLIVFVGAAVGTTWAGPCGQRYRLTIFHILLRMTTPMVTLYFTFSTSCPVEIKVVKNNGRKFHVMEYSNT